jgi:hypothetical protein
MQEPRKQPEVPARQKSFQELERERICAESDKLRAPKEEETDWNDPTLCMDSDELQAYYKGKLEKETKETQLDRRNAVMNRIYAKDAPPAEGPDDKVTEEEAWSAFRERHPELTKADCDLINSEKFYGQDPELLGLKAEAWANPGSPSVAEKVLDRAAEILATKRKEAERRAYVNLMMRDRTPEDAGRLARLEAVRKAAKI